VLARGGVQEASAGRNLALPADVVTWGRLMRTRASRRPQEGSAVGSA
jgi:hypothetical protein